MFLLSRAEAHGVLLRREFLNLDDILAESARAFRVLAQQRGVTVMANGDEEVRGTRVAASRFMLWSRPCTGLENPRRLLIAHLTRATCLGRSASRPRHTVGNTQ